MYSVVPFLLLYGYLFDAALVTSTLEGRGKEFLHNVIGFVVGDKAAGHHEHIGIVVLAGQFGDVRVPAEGGADALVFVQGHGDAVAATADGDTGVALACLNSFSQGVSEVGVVATLWGVGAKILEFIAVLF